MFSATGVGSSCKYLTRVDTRWGNLENESKMQSYFMNVAACYLTVIRLTFVHCLSSKLGSTLGTGDKVTDYINLIKLHRHS